MNLISLSESLSVGLVWVWPVTRQWKYEVTYRGWGWYINAFNRVKQCIKILDGAHGRVYTKTALATKLMI